MNDAMQPGLDIDIFQYVAEIFDHWKIILASAVLFAALVYGYTETLPDVFEAFAKVSIVDPDDPGGIQPDERRASEVLTLVEHGFVMGSGSDNYHQVMRARLRSRQFTYDFMLNHGVMQELYAEHWDSNTESWIDGFEPSKADSIKWFGEQIRIIEHNPETDIITLRMRWTDPAIAKRWANDYIAAFNNYVRTETLAEVDRKRGYLYAELERSSVVDIQKSIYRLIEAQTAIAMLANGRDEYVLEVIDPATIPFDRFSPAPRRLTVFGFVAGFMFAISAIVGRRILINMINTLKAFQSSNSATISAPGEAK